MEAPPRWLFFEPRGWSLARVHVAGALALIGIYAYFELRYGSGLVSTLVIGFASGLAGLAEMLPSDRRRTAGALRVAAVGVLVALMVRSLLALVS